VTVGRERDNRHDVVTIDLTSGGPNGLAKLAPYASSRFRLYS
jgi:hypothetical protein